MSTSKKATPKRNASGNLSALNAAKLRDTITATGSFVSLPEAFPGAADSVKLAPKIELCVARYDNSSKPLKTEMLMKPHAILIDLEAVDAQAFDFQALIRDCDVVKRAAQSHPNDLQRILAAFAPTAPHERILEAAEIATKLGLSEEAIKKSGGGVLFLLVMLAAAVMAGCKGCAHGKGAFRQ